MVSNNLPSSIFVRKVNKMEGLYRLIGAGLEDLPSSISFHVVRDLQGNLYISVEELNNLDSTVDVFKVTELTSTVQPLLSDSLPSMLLIKPNNKMEGVFNIIGAGEEDLPSEVTTHLVKDLYGELTVRADRLKDLEGTVDVFIVNDLPSSVQSRINIDLPSTVLVKPNNKMEGTFEIVAPPIITENLAPIKDTFIRSDLGSMNYGGFGDMFIGRDWSGTEYKSLIQFNIDGIPENKVIKKATLHLHHYDTTSSGELSIRSINAEDSWTEYGVTWLNQPGAGEVLETFRAPSSIGEVVIDLTDTVTEWYGGEQDNGWVISSEGGEIRTNSFGTKESPYRPILKIEYYDPFVYSYDRTNLRSSVYVRNVDNTDLVGQVNVNQVNFYSDLPGVIRVNNPDELESTVFVNKPTLQGTVTVVVLEDQDLPSSVVVKIGAEDELESTVGVRGKETEDLPSSIIVTEHENLPGTVEIPKIGELLSTVVVRVEEKEELVSTVVVHNISELPGMVDPHIVEDLSSTVIVRVENKEDLSSTVEVRDTVDLGGKVDVRVVEDLPSTVTVTISGIEDIESSVDVYSVSDLTSTVDVRETDDLNSNLTVKIARFEELPGSVELNPYSDLKGSLFVRSDTIYGDLIVRNVADEELVSSVDAREVEDLESSIIVVGVGNSDLHSTVTIHTTKDLQSTVDVMETNDLPSEMVVKIARDGDLVSSVLPRVLLVSDLDSIVEVVESTDLIGNLVVRAKEDNDLPSSVHLPAREDLDSSVEVTVKEDLYSSVEVVGVADNDLQSTLTILEEDSLPGQVQVRYHDYLLSTLFIRPYNKMEGTFKIVSSTKSKKNYAFIM